jgi:hypothetical protein
MESITTARHNSGDFLLRLKFDDKTNRLTVRSGRGFHVTDKMPGDFGRAGRMDKVKC